MKRQLRRRPRGPLESLVRRTERMMVEGCERIDQFKRAKEYTAARFKERLHAYIAKGIPLPVALEAVDALVEDPLVRRVLEQRERV